MKAGNVEKVVGIIANVGVIVGIIFLALELQQSNQLLRAEAIGSVLETRMLRQETRLNNPQVTELIGKNRRQEPISDVERLTLNSLYSRALLGWQRDYFLLQEGILTDAMFRANVAVMKSNFLRQGETYGPLEHWNGNWSGYADPAFRAFVEQCVISDCEELPR